MSGAARSAARGRAAAVAVARQSGGLAVVSGRVLAVGRGGWRRRDRGSVGAGLLGYAAVSGVVQDGLALWLYLLGLRRLPASTAGMWLALTPVFGILGAFLVLGEVPTGLMLLGAVFVIGALVYAGREA